MLFLVDEEENEGSRSTVVMGLLELCLRECDGRRGRVVSYRTGSRYWTVRVVVVVVVVFGLLRGRATVR